MVKSDTSKVPPPRSNTKIHAGDDARVLGRLTLGVVEIGGHCDDRVSHLFAQVGLGYFLHFAQHHGRHFFGSEQLLLVGRLHLDVGLVVFVDHFERPVLHVALDGRVLELAADQTLGVEYRVLRVGRELVFGGIADQALALARKRHVGRSDPVALVVGDYFHATVLHYANARVCGAQVDAYDRAVALFFLVLFGVQIGASAQHQQHKYT
ncbi:NAD-specific glutamate dehydrogenase [Brachionus plicatilis]|uniref:NAD-specific glutamate dehydrogenase n=1 Tax=Brachionus plicatilis TaxID=10195 RepID=A0A3M7R240_BRAPC|nr:NAD-specific glutamate dehydrogenase [Brachionus plicatilis]